MVADLKACAIGIRPPFQHAAHNFMPHGQRQLHPAIGQLQVTARPQIIAAFPNMKIGMANAGVGYFKQYLLARRLRRRDGDFLKGLASFNNGPGAHDGVSLMLVYGGMGSIVCPKVKL